MSDFIAGMKEGVRRYAWMKDGTYYVGDGHHTLKRALEKIDEDFADLPPGVQRRDVKPAPPNTPGPFYSEWA